MKREVYTLEVAGPYKAFACAGRLVANSHACAYAALAYQSAYLKTHYPEEYWAAWLNAQTPAKQRETIAVAHPGNFRLLHFDLQVSETNFTPAANGVVPPLTLLTSVGRQACDIVKERAENGPYENFAACRRRLASIIAPEQWAALAWSGALDSLTGGRRQSLEALCAALPDPWREKLAPPPNFTASIWSETYWRRRWEEKAAGVALTPHPLAAVRPYLEACGVQMIAACRREKTPSRMTIAFVLHEKGENGKLTAEDETGVIELGGRIDAQPGSWFLAEIEQTRKGWTITRTTRGEKVWEQSRRHHINYKAVCVERLLALYRNAGLESVGHIASHHRKTTANDIEHLVRWEAENDPQTLAERIATGWHEGFKNVEIILDSFTDEETRRYFFLKGVQRLLRNEVVSENVLETLFAYGETLDALSEKLQVIRMAAEHGWMPPATVERLMGAFHDATDPNMQIEILSALNGTLSKETRRQLIADTLAAPAVEPRWWLLKHLTGLEEHRDAEDPRERECARLHVALRNLYAKPETDWEPELEQLVAQTGEPFQDALRFERERTRTMLRETHPSGVTHSGGDHVGTIGLDR